MKMSLVELFTARFFQAKSKLYRIRCGTRSTSPIMGEKMTFGLSAHWMLTLLDELFGKSHKISSTVN